MPSRRLSITAYTRLHKTKATLITDCVTGLEDYETVTANPYFVVSSLPLKVQKSAPKQKPAPDEDESDDEEDVSRTVRGSQESIAAEMFSRLTIPSNNDDIEDADEEADEPIVAFDV